MEPLLPLMLIVIANFALYWVFWGQKKFQNQNNFLKRKKHNKKLEGENVRTIHRR